jgi:hypothetical protein
MTMTNIVQNSTPTEPSLSDLLNLLKKEIFIDLNCHHLATIQSFNSTTQTVQATINYTKTSFTLDVSTNLYVATQTNYPLIVDMPVVILGGGSAYLTMPIAQGDQCIILFNDRSIDNWFQGGQVGPVATSRFHSFADGVALVGLNYLTGTGNTTALMNYDSARAVLRNGTTGVGVSTTKVKIFNATTTLNTVLQNILTQLQTLANTNAVNGSPVNPAVATQLATLATQLGGLIE